MAGRQLPSPRDFGSDDGSADPALAQVLAAYVAGATDLRTVQQALLGRRVLVPVVAAADDAPHATRGRHGEHGAHMALVTVTGRDGRRALPVFTSLETLARWDPSARPVPTTAGDAARGAYAEGAAALLVDPTRTAVAVIEGAALLALAEDRPWLPAAEDPEVLGAIRSALAGLPGLSGVDVARSTDADLTLTLHIPDAPGTNGQAAHDAARHVAQAAANRLAELALLRTRLDRGLDVTVVRD